MAAYDDRGQFSTVNFKIISIKPTTVQGTLKTNIGKTFVEKAIPGRNTNNTVLQIKGIITGLSRAFGETEQTAIDRDRTALINLDDGFKHLYNDGKHVNLEMVIIKGSLVWNDDADRNVNENPNEFNFTLKEW